MKKNRKKMQNARQFKSENIMKYGKANRGFALVLIAVLTIATMCMGGCNSGTNDDEVTVSSETEEADVTNVAEEPVESEHIDQEPAVNGPEVTEEPEVVEEPEVDFSQYDNPLDLIADMEHDELKIIVWGEQGGIQILSDGDSYVFNEGEHFEMYFPRENLQVQCEMYYFDVVIQDSISCAFLISNVTGTDLEVPITATAPDGTEYSITVYITKEWE